MSDHLTDPATSKADLPPQLPLRTCPWCGEVPLLDTCLHHGYYVYCDAEACRMALVETRPCDTPELAAQVWNARA